jgi:hypothetical protein
MHAFPVGRLFNFDHFSGKFSRGVPERGRAALRNGRCPARSLPAEAFAGLFAKRRVIRFRRYARE